ncbi:hypothetical protein VNI00_002372 [Paramarasmius palmivorus]|uniref:Uncharacterized protein n=1 Tax=Paramarasmius palmivorus TaxID=297713 RepID=A0AAW0E184_9AGAR
MSFHRSSQVSIRGQNRLTNVGRDQYNNNSNNRTIINKRTTIRMAAAKSTKQAAKQGTKYDEFTAVKHGDIIVVKDLHEEDLADWDRISWGSGGTEYRIVRECKRTIQTIQVYPDRQSKFTALVYEGDSEDARSYWEEDFRQFSGTRFVSSHHEKPE